VSARPAPNAARKRRIKASLISRDGMACFYCRTPFADAAAATVDHLVPQSHIPGWRLANLVLACEPCNHAKADLLPQALLRPARFGPGLVPLHSGAHLALAGAA
jgi:5-methylcytosine-specific restriction endonuclease McrA